MIKSEITSSFNDFYPGGSATVRYAGFGFNEIRVKGLVYDPTGSALPGEEMLCIDQMSIKAPWKQWFKQEKEIEVTIPLLHVRWVQREVADQSKSGIDDF